MSRGSVLVLRFGNTQWDGTSPTFSSDWQLLQQLAGFRDGLTADASSIMD